MTFQVNDYSTLLLGRKIEDKFSNLKSGMYES